MRDAFDFGNVCTQIPLAGPAVGDEDCLYLNVWSPDTKPKTKKPVMVFIYGGAYLFGSGNQDLFFDGTGDLYEGTHLATENDAVVVTFNYRLAELGFLAHPALTANDANGSSGNYGIQDQIAALHWVQENIASFGGDPSNVTLFGESAGGLSTCLLTSSPLAQGLFSKAIIESGGCIVATQTSRFSQGQDIAAQVGCDTADDVAACLRSKPVSAFETQPATGFGEFLFDNDIQRAWEMPYGPNIDGYVFKEAPLTALREGHTANVPIIVGSNATEFELFTPPNIVTCLDYAAEVESLFGTTEATSILTEYNCFDYALPRYAAVDVGTDFMFTCPARRIARAAAKGGAPSVHRYYDPHVYTNSPMTTLRSFHASELPFVFHTFDVFGYQPTAGDEAVSRAMGLYWGQFARSGDPNGTGPIQSGLIQWPAWDQDSDTAVVFDDTLSTKGPIAKDHCDFWDKIANDN